MADETSGKVRRSGVTRCAIYTRKSSEEGLEQEFNSLDAQREACEAYIKSQQHEGWTTLATMYDDGGISGGTMERPALKRMLADIEAKKVDTVVVYKVDRLTRSLSDFAKIVDVFDAQGVSFVSITQQFNTTTSMGRLTLNMLLSFAQFEREVTGERIRDKIAASKKKGMWMGGNPPLGYDVLDRKLIVNEGEAERVRHIFRRYAALGSVRLLCHELERDGIFSKARHRATGQPYGAKPFARGALYLMLQNRIYRGEIVHKETSYPGEHAAIIDEELWNAVAERLAENRNEHSSGAAAQSPSLLVHLLHDETGKPMTPTHAVKNGRRYRYYISRALVTASRSQVPGGRRIPAGDIEQLVVDRLCTFLTNRSDVHEALGARIPDAAEQEQLIERAAELGRTWRKRPVVEQRVMISSLAARIEISADRIDIHLDRARLAALLRGDQRTRRHTRSEAGPATDTIVLSIPARLKRAGIGKRMVIEGAHAGAPDDTLIKLVVNAFALRDKLLAGGGISIDELSAREKLTGSYATRLLRLTFLAPDLVRDILDGRHPPTLTANNLMADTRLPLPWTEQRLRLATGRP
jgi:DNA invertase Pin-like site-specific DNA recombinase